MAAIIHNEQIAFGVELLQEVAGHACELYL
jgi:hypothetical protein